MGCSSNFSFLVNVGFSVWFCPLVSRWFFVYAIFSCLNQRIVGFAKKGTRFLKFILEPGHLVVTHAHHLYFSRLYPSDSPLASGANGNLVPHRLLKTNVTFYNRMCWLFSIFHALLCLLKEISRPKLISIVNSWFWFFNSLFITPRTAQCREISQKYLCIFNKGDQIMLGNQSD